MAALRLFPSISSAPVEALKAQERTREIIKGVARRMTEQARANMSEDGSWGEKTMEAKDIISLLRESER